MDLHFAQLHLIPLPVLQFLSALLTFSVLPLQSCIGKDLSLRSLFDTQELHYHAADKQKMLYYPSKVTVTLRVSSERKICTLVLLNECAGIFC